MMPNVRWFFYQAKATAQSLLGAAGFSVGNWKRPEPYGITTKPPLPGTATCATIGGNPGETIVICLSSDYGKPDVAQDEVAIWNKAGAYIRLKANGAILIRGTVRIEGDLRVSGDISTDSKSGGYNSHTHTGDSGGTTSAPNN